MFRRFDRHQDMTPQTVDKIMKLLRDERLEQTDLLRNSLYGLFDGYLYNSLQRICLPENKDMALLIIPVSILSDITYIVNEIQNYKTLEG